MILEKPVLLIGGKGGVGKTTLAASIALLNAERGRPTRLISTDPAHSLSDLFQRPIGPDPISVADSLEAMELDQEQETEKYLNEVKQNISEVSHPNIRDEANRQIDLARFSPGAEEYALFYRFAREIGGKSHGKSLIFDTAPTGHTLRLLRLPEVMEQWLAGFLGKEESHQKMKDIFSRLTGDDDSSDQFVLGLDSVRERMELFQQIREILTDDREAEFLMVCNPDTLSIRETEMSVHRLGELGIRVRNIIVNKCYGDGQASSKEIQNRQDQHLLQIRTKFSDLQVHPVSIEQTELLGLEALRRFSSTLKILHP